MTETKPIRRGRRVILTGVALLVMGCASKPLELEPLERRYTPAQLRQDAEVARRAIYEGAPQLYRWRPQREIDSAFAALDGALASPMTAAQFWRVMARTIASVRDDHLTLIPSQRLFNSIFQPPAGRVLPLSLRVIEGRLFVRRNYLPSSRMVAGSEVLSIEGRPAADALQECAEHLSADGEVRSRPMRRIERDFPWTCGIVMGLPATYHFTYRLSDDPTVRFDTLATMDWGARRKLIAASWPRDTLPEVPGSLELLSSDSVAILTLRTFDKSDAFNPTKFIDSSFAEVRRTGARALIIDLRPNHGGLDAIGAHLLSYIATDTFTYARRYLKKNHYDFVEGFDGWLINMALRTKYRPARTADGRYVLQEDFDKLHRPRADAFRGRVLLLADGTSVSTASEVATLAQDRGFATLIGEESANARAGGSGAAQAIELPHTRLILNVPLVTYETALQSPGEHGRGALPNVAIPPAIADVVADRDPVKAAAIELARRR